MEYTTTPCYDPSQIRITKTYEPASFPVFTKENVNKAIKNIRMDEQRIWEDYQERLSGCHFQANFEDKGGQSNYRPIMMSPTI